MKMNTTLVIPRHIHRLSGHSEPGHFEHARCIFLNLPSFFKVISLFQFLDVFSVHALHWLVLFYHSVQVAQAIPVLNLKHDLISSLQLKLSNIFSSDLVQSQIVLKEISYCPSFLFLEITSVFLCFIYSMTLSS